MKAEIFSIGSELTWGKNLDTNAQWLSQRLAENGIFVAFHTTVSDDMDDMIRSLAIACQRTDFVILTGGLGPTLDDLTREAVAKVMGVSLELDPDSLATIEGMFTRRGRTMPERNRVQAMFPKGTRPIPNPCGTAPGIFAEHDGALIACLPGVPSEMKEMFAQSVLPEALRRFGGGKAYVSRTIRCYGAGESAIEEMLGDLTRRGRQPEVGITASEATISLRIFAEGTTPEEARAKADVDASEIYAKLGKLIYGEEDETLQAVVVRLLTQRKQTVATAESCTGGLVGNLITDIPGSSDVYPGGIVSYSNAAKNKFLGVPNELLETVGAVSPEVASAMATGARKVFGADYGLGITGIAGPGGGTETKPVGLVYIALAHADGVEVTQYNWSSSRTSTKLRSAKAALQLLRQQLAAQ